MKVKTDEREIERNRERERERVREGKWKTRDNF